ncbi:TPA: LysR family transcriptional regulator [Burkholderia contaminans]|uniref:LysR family transcriptional regulator n=1 Tax=Burkholderia TaxID=32008 RepID=UPI000757EEB0|nr:MULTISPECIES: LysR family transcriptional regulator [Burkholderia]KVS30783.1 LysR family transcriptional regulator [Burkholderia vietnamiensis]MBM6431234.1 LysR family transcriptional regulator [Burkholderia contaminans]MBR7913841.1 LysR family transcriptional regulator [Burkholderia vietnamiensis]MBR8003701.1 LysR family transcriptional regulator [Burkholderia vietnamiensis]MBR8015802.1 LysR family transcriptional regulator [Burkholderia vietnamiensis]
MLDMRQLQYFIAVAEEEHVGRAAERLHISQSPLSRQIAQFEEKLGLTLFERSQQRIRLTRDGHTFLSEARAFIRHANRLESLGRRLGRGDEGGLCIGYLETAMHSGVLPRALKTLRAERPAVHIALYNYSSAAQLEGLRERSLDIALVCDPPSVDDTELDSALVLNDPMVLAVPDEHPLAGKRDLTADDLAAQHWIGVAQQETASRHGAFVAACAKAGFSPNITVEATEPLAALGLVTAELGVTMIQQSLRHQVPEGVTLRELPWFSYHTPLWAAWHQVNLRPLVGIFREILTSATIAALADA